MAASPHAVGRGGDFAGPGSLLLGYLEPQGLSPMEPSVSDTHRGEGEGRGGGGGGGLDGCPRVTQGSGTFHQRVSWVSASQFIRNKPNGAILLEKVSTAH